MSGRRLQITLQPEVLRWARERAGLQPDVLADKVNVKPERVQEWEKSGLISIAQADKLSHHTHTPLGFLYLSEPVKDYLPITDFRTVGDQPLGHPSPDLLETIQLMQRRQAWMHDELIEQGIEPLNFVGTVDMNTPPEEVAGEIRSTMGLELDWSRTQPSWEEALRFLRGRVEEIGVLVVVNGIVGNNTHRKLDPDEFRGFALVDKYAPLVFVNGADYKVAQMFTLAHEVAHIWIGKGGLSNYNPLRPRNSSQVLAVEQFCNQAAAEFLVPAREFRSAWNEAGTDPYQSLARRFKVSTIVIARRALDLDLINRNDFFDFYKAWNVDERRKQERKKPGGSFWNNQNVRIGKRFGEAVVRAVKEGRLLYREAFSLTGLKSKSFDTFVEHIEGT